MRSSLLMAVFAGLVASTPATAFAKPRSNPQPAGSTPAQTMSGKRRRRQNVIARLRSGLHSKEQAMTDKPTSTDAELKAMWRIHAADIGGIFCYARAVLAKWGQPAQAGEPFGYFHQLLNHEGKGNGVWLGAAERKVVEQAHTPGETSEEIVALYTTPQPTQAQAGAVPLDEARRLFGAGWKAAALLCDREDVVADGIIGFGACPQFEAAFSAAHGIKGAPHVGKVD